MPGSTSFFPSIPLPALYLYPIDDSFVPKHISLAGNQRVKIGRQTNAKSIPGERNGYFDSKVLSRQHAEVWEENGKILIRDVKSSNGTFINGERLSAEGMESEPYDLKTDDIVEFGIDIVGEDNKTVVHHKVSARVVCVFSEQDAQAAARVEQSHTASMHTMNNHAGPSNGSTFNFSNQGGPSQRRPSLQQGLSGMGGMGGSMRPPGKSGLTFDHILSRLQGELQKSRETGAELHNITGAMSELHDTIGGALPQNLPSYPHSLPPIRQPPPQPEQPEAHLSAPILNDLQGQLHETQTSLATHVDKIRQLEGVFGEHEVLKHEVTMSREMMEDLRRDMEALRTAGTIHNRFEHRDDDDDARSVRTVVPHELERVEEEDEDQLTAEEEDDEERRQRREELGRPRTPEPTGMGLRDDEYEPRAAKLRRGGVSPSPDDSSRDQRAIPTSVAEELSARITALSEQLQNALSMSSALLEQHSAAQTTITALESKIASLESAVQGNQSSIKAQQEIVSSFASRSDGSAPPPPSSEEAERESLTAMLNEWKKGVEGQWSSVREEWSQERERLSKAREEWESRVKGVETGLTSTEAKIEASLASLLTSKAEGRSLPNGVAPNHTSLPSPRSLSSESHRRQRRRRSTSSRGRSRSRSVDAEVKEEDTTASESTDSTDAAHSTNPEARSPSKRSNGATSWVAHQRQQQGALLPNDHNKAPLDPRTMQTAIGVLVLSVAAAAVVWRVKAE